MQSLFSAFQQLPANPSGQQQQPPAAKPSEKSDQPHHYEYKHPSQTYQQPPPPPPPPVSPSRETLLTAAQAFCNAFASGHPPETILAQHFTRRRSRILVLEHGLAQLAPFLGRTFRGAEGLIQYLSVVSECLSFEGMRFTEYTVDAEARRVAVRGQARFTWKSTGQVWDEEFVYVLAFDGEARVEKYEIWADSGAAWLASRGEL
jgi:hypothetical protein